MADLPINASDAQPVNITDPTVQTQAVNVKAASTAAGTADNSLVVALSPNSPVPTGTNKIGVTGVAQGSTTSGEYGDLIQGAVTTTAPVYSTGQTSPLSLTTVGNLRVDGSSVTQPVSGTVTANQGTAAATTAGWPIIGGNITESTAAWTSSTTVNTALTLTVTGYNSVLVTLNQGSTITGGVVTFEISDTTGFTNAYSIDAVQVTDGSIFGSIYTLVQSTNQAFYVNVRGAAAFRVRLSTVISGTGTINVGISTNAMAGDPIVGGTVTAKLNDGSGNSISSTSGNLNVEDRADATIASSVGTASGFAIGTSGLYNTIQPAPTNGQQVEFQVDQSGNLLKAHGISFKAGTAWNSSTTINTLQYPTGTATPGGFVGAPHFIVQLDQTTTLTGGAVTWQGTYDNINWVTIPNVQVVNPAGFTPIGNPYTFVASTNQAFLIHTDGYIGIRANLTTVITGTGTVTPYWTALPISPLQPVLSSPIDGRRTTYRAASGTVTTNVVTPSFTPVIGILFQLEGSSTKTIRIIRFVVNGSAAAIGTIDVAIQRRSSAASGGTAVTPTIAVLDGNDAAATAVATYYTAAPTAGTFVSNYVSERLLLQAAPTVVPSHTEFYFGNTPGAKAFVLRGTGDYFTVSLAGTLPATPVMDFWCEWTEE